jgi:tetratricopeptide (TPR) repeat protein
MSKDIIIPPEASDLFKKGQSYCSLVPPDYPAAERCFRRLIEVAPAWGEGFHVLAHVLERQGRLEEANTAAHTAVALLPGDPRPVIALGYYFLLVGKYNEAVHFLEEGLALKPHYGEADARFMLAEAFERLGQIPKAAVLWRQIIEMPSAYPSHDRPMKESKRKLAQYASSGDTIPN